MTRLHSTLRALLFSLAALFLPVLALAQTVLSTATIGSGPQAIVVDPVGDKTYIAQHGSPGTVRVIDNATGAVTTILAGAIGLPTIVAVDPTLGQVMVGGLAGAALLDGSTFDFTPVVFQSPPATPTIAGAVVVPRQTALTAVLTDSANHTAWLASGANAAKFSAVGSSLTCPGPVAILPVFFDTYIANPCTTSVVEFFGPSATPKTFTVAGNPVAIAANPVTSRVYIAETGSSVDVIDASSFNAPVLMAPITGLPSTATAIAVNPATNKIYVANGSANAVTIIDGTDNTKTSVTVGTNPVGLSIDSVRNQVYVLNQTGGTVTVIDGATNVASSPLTVGASSNAIAVNPLTSRVFAASISGNTLTTIDGRQYTDGTLPYAAVAAAVNPLTQRAYLALSGVPGVVKVLDEATDALVATVTVGSNPTQMAVDLSLNRIYVVDATDHTVTAINGSDNTVAGTVTLVDTPGAILVNPSTHKVYVAHSTSGRVSIIDGTNLAAPVKTANVGGTPVGLALGEAVNTVFVADATGSTPTVPTIDGTSDATGITSINNAFPVSDIAVDPTNGHLFVAHAGANLVEELKLLSAGSFLQYSAVNLYTVTNPTRLAVNKANHRVYVASGTSLAAIAPSTTLGVGVTTATLSQAPLFVALDDYADRLVVSGSSGFILVDGQSLHELNVANTTTASGPGLAAIDPSIGKAYVPSSADVAVHVVKETTAVPIPLDGITLAAMAGGHVTSAANPVIQLANCCNFQALIALSSAPDGPHGGTTLSASASDLLSTELTGIAPGLHFVTLYYLDAMTGTSIDPQPGSSGGTSIMIGQPTIFPVLKVNAPTLVTSALVAGKVGVPYNQSVSAIGGTGGLTFSLAGGALPDGLSLASDGTISGTPTLAGIFSFAVAVVDGSGGSNTATTGISITAGSLAASPGSVAFGNVVAAQPQTQAVTIVNNGTGTTQISSASITLGSDVFAIPADGCISTPLTHNQTCTIQVSFTPAAGGPRTGTLHLTTTDAGALTIDVPLAGTGVFMLTVVTNGTGTGSMTSSSPGIACPGDCTEIYAAGTAVTLTEVVGVGSIPEFLVGCDTKIMFQCMLTMNANRTVTATFTAIMPSVIALEGWQEAPYVDTGAHGTATLVFDSFAQDLNVQWALTGLTGALTGVTINGPAARGASGAVLHTLSTATIGNEHVTLTPSEVTAAQEGQLYINVTTTDDPGGQIRGQIDSLGATTVRSVAALTLGSGSGTVTGTTEAGDVVACGSTCFASIPDGKSITFAATPAAGSLFAGWGGACSGTGACQVAMNAAKTVIATFNLLGSPTTTLSPSATTVVAGADLTLTATLSGSVGTPTGSVTFQDGAVSIGTVALDGSGHAVLTTSALAVGSHNLTVSYPGDTNYAAATSTPVTVNVTTPAEANPPRLGAISTRMQVLTGDNVLIGGFIISGSTPKTVVVRARGPSLASSGIANFLANPVLQLVASDGTVTTNDDWQSAANAAQIQASGFAPSDSRESAILVTLAPGPYTAILSGAGGTTGVGLVEVFEVDHPENPLAGISTRGRVLTGNDVMIGGLIIQGNAPQTVIVRARGPSLASQGVSGVLTDPVLQLVASDGTVTTNDDWQSASNAAQIQASGFAPADPHESAILVTLNPGAYTAIVSGVGGSTGVAIVEVFAQ